MIWFYVYKSLSLYIRWIETVHINNKIILHFLNLWSKEVIGDIIYPITVNKIDRYLDTITSHTSISYIISRDKEINERERKK